MKGEPSRIYSKHESGAVLVVGLVMVLLISIIALSAIRSSNLQEAMAGNMRDKNIAFQAAESALVVGELDVDLKKSAPICNGKATCYLRHSQAIEESVIYLDDTSFNNAARVAGIVLAGVEEKPTFIIEELTPFTPLDGSALEKGAGLTDLLPYRITSRGTGLGPNSSVTLQSTYNRFANSD